jgi:hypothetical protein
MSKVSASALSNPPLVPFPAATGVGMMDEKDLNP